MPLSSKSIETISVSAVKSSIAMCDYLSEYIPDNDKEPSWDGFIYSYYDSSKQKSKLNGRVAVQVKGKVCEDHSKQEIPYPVSTVDLKNYLNDGGCIFFVVYVSETGDKTKIYYSQLTPVKLKNILEKH